MGRAPCCDKTKVKRGPWSPEEDSTLKNYVEKYGTGGNWIALPHKAGLKRCGKSCRLRWLNYLRPDIKHGGFTEEEDNIIINLYRNIGSRWSVIASQLPGRTDNDVKNYWNTKLKKKLLAGAMSQNSAVGNNTTNPSNFTSNPLDFGLQAPPAPLTKHQTSYYGNSSSNTLPAAYQMDMINHHSTEFVSEMFYNESIDNLPLPRLMEVQENGTTYNNGFTTSSSQEISSLSPSYSLGTSTYAASNWSDNTVGEEVGFLMELGSKPSYALLDDGFDYQENLTGAEEIDHITTTTSNPVNYSYSSTSSLLANIGEIEPSPGLHHHQSNISN